MRIGLLGFHHEANSFAARPTGLADFRSYRWLEGAAVREEFTGQRHEVTGMMSAVGAVAGWEAVPVWFGEAMTGGPLDAAAEWGVWEAMSRALDRAGRVEALLVAVHGAAVGVTRRDYDGWWLGRLRERVGPGTPVVAVLDSHANVSPAMVAALDAAVSYRSNPHVDQEATGRRAVSLLRRWVEGGVRPALHHVALPLVLNIERQRTDEPPCRDWLAMGDGLAGRRGVWSSSLCLGYPYADVEEMGVSLLLVADAGQPAASAWLAGWGKAVWAERERARPSLLSVHDAVAAVRQGPGTTGLLDMGDNIGGGGPGDLTALAHALRDADAGPVFVNLTDAAAVDAARVIGVGGRVGLLAGGTLGPERFGPPLRVAGVVAALTDGRWTDPTPLPDGRVDYREGPMAFVRTADGSVVQLSARRVFPVSLGQLQHAGVQPRDFRAVVIKGVHAPAAAYGPAVDRLLRVDTPGPTAANILRWPYRHRRRPMFPFEDDAPGPPELR